MRWVVDGTALCYQLTGIGQYSFHLLQALSAQRPDWEFHVLTPYAPLAVPQARNVSWDPILSRSLAVRTVGWRNWWFERELVRVTKELRPDRFWSASGLTPFGLPEMDVAMTVHDFVADRFPQTMGLVPRMYRRWNTRYWLPRARWLLPVSRAVATEMTSRYGVESAGVVYPGLDEAFSAGLSRTRADTADEYVIAVGTLEPRKNLLTMIRAIESLIEDGVWPTTLRLCLVGAKGWRDGELLRAVRRLEASGTAIILGYVERDRLSTLIGGAKALLMPSMYEGFGIPVLEALSAECPVICSDMPVFHEIVSPPFALFHGTEHDQIRQVYADWLTNRAVLERPVGKVFADRFSWAKSAQCFVQAVS